MKEHTPLRCYRTNAQSTDHFVLFGRKASVACQEMTSLFGTRRFITVFTRSCIGLISLSFSFPLHECIYVPSSSACYMSGHSHLLICRSDGVWCRVSAVQQLLLICHGSRNVVSRSVFHLLASIFRVRVTTGTLCDREHPVTS